MSDGIVVEVQGARELRRTLKAAGADMADLKTVHDKIASFVGASAAARTPRRSGMLATSWSGRGGATRATVRFTARYANAIHWGTGPRPGRRGPHNITPTRFVTEAAAATEPTWVGFYLDEVDRILDRVKGA